MIGTNQITACFTDSIDASFIGQQFRFKILMLLDLGLEIGGIFVRLIPGSLAFLVYPVFCILVIPYELLKAVRLLKLGASLGGLFQELGTTSEDHLSSCVHCICCIVLSTNQFSGSLV